MASRMESASAYTQTFRTSDEFSSVSAVSHGALGAGQVSALREEVLLPRIITPPAATFRAGLPRFAGGLLSLAASGFELIDAYNIDRHQRDDTFRETRRQLVISAISTSAGLGAGSLAGAAAAGLVVAGAPAAAVTAITVTGVVAAGIAASYAYEWARGRARVWIP